MDCGWSYIRYYYDTDPRQPVSWYVCLCRLVKYDDAFCDVAMAGLRIRIYISQSSWEKLVTHARLLGYVRNPNDDRGMGRFIDALSRCDMTDGRPPEYKEYDAIAAKFGREPNWSKGFPLICRFVSIPGLSAKTLIDKCSELGIKCKKGSDTAVIGRLLEAIAGGDVKVDIPAHTYKTKPRGDTWEVEW